MRPTQFMYVLFTTATALLIRRWYLLTKYPTYTMMLTNQSDLHTPRLKDMHVE